LRCSWKKVDTLRALLPDGCMKRLIFAVLVIVILFTVGAPDRAVAQDALLEWLIEQDVEFSDQNAAIDYLEELARSPVNVNSASLVDLLRIPGITLFQARSVIESRNNNGLFNKLYEVKDAGKFSEGLFSLISPFMTLSRIPSRKVEMRQRSLRELEKRRAFTDGTYAGSILKNYTRLQYMHNASASCGFLVEKDAGEACLTDHSVMYARWESQKKNVDITVGNFSLDFGQGLLFARPGFFSKSSDPIQPVIRAERGVKGYVSSSELVSLRGAAFHSSIRQTEVYTFYSSASRDVYIDDLGQVTGFRTSGYHRTETENSGKNRLNETVRGFRIKYDAPYYVMLGITGAAVRYSSGIVQDDSKFMTFAFSGNKLRTAGADISFNVKNMRFGAEYGVSDPGTAGFVSGITWSDGPTVVGLLYRDYARDFYSPFGSSFSDRWSEIRNERGLYFGLKHRLDNGIIVSLYVDNFENPWRSVSVPVNQKKSDLFFQIRKRFASQCDIVVNWKRRTGPEACEYLSDSGISLTTYEDVASDRLRIQGSRQINSRFHLFSRLELLNEYCMDADNGKIFGGFENTGMLASIRVRTLIKEHSGLNAGLTAFSTGQMRSYQYETDLPGLFTMKQFSGRGERLAFIFFRKYRIGQINAKYAIIHYTDRDYIGQGGTRINKNFVQEIGLQLDLVF